MQSQPITTRNQHQQQSTGLPVRTNLRAGLAWDDLDDQAASLWNSLTGAISKAADSVTTNVTPTQS